ncbi:hypothetical protein [Streptomyces mobaraensis]|uniref:Uncharacterized protein n=1 Tax=Streptomyces mobaraensis TaxID=35621 RepID=A0A5N5W5B3_STRMB|nr:hypothetical protein [Streptomyces mobaraensis]KAB7839512.1 hypothetical protein FRZ00_21490 [Streptomyces mobaraensis]
MPEHAVPDELFDADDEYSLAVRYDWVVQDGHLVHAPVVGWTWACAECSESGSLPKILVHLASLHRTQHAAGPFNTLVPLLVSVVRKFPDSPPQAD